MPCRPALSRLALCRALAALALALLASAAWPQSLEGLLMPGKLIVGHAKLEGDCANCHVRFDRAAQDRLCMDCHKDVAADARQSRGHHGRIQALPCRSCHTEHKGREARIAPLEEAGFDHKLTDFPLRGAHAPLECASCHRRGARHRDAPGQCVSCHRKDDAHKERLGPACGDCHAETRWKDVRFDHTKTRFALGGKHAQVACKECHRDNLFKSTPLACASCHARDDKHKGRLGEKCESCHSATSWSAVTFDHDRHTKYPLLGRHRAVQCYSCHAANPYREKLQTGCVACHRKDDKHRGTLGAACGDCHTERSWQQARFDHSKTRFPLLGKHQPVECKACHKSAVFREAPTDCAACHKKDDKHKGALGPACGDCHTERDWKQSKFDHGRARFALLGRHRSVQCAACHKDPNFRQTPSECAACHKKDDRHEGQLGLQCGQCHGAQDWRKTSFDHGRAAFPLVGRHLMVQCRSCHATARYKDARRDCVGCHAQDDIHKRRLGPQCESCHNARDWKTWDFNHDRQTRFRLDGAHRRLECYACHRDAVGTKPTLAAACVACHARDDVHDGSFGRQCDSCHFTSSFKQVKPLTGGARHAR